MISSFFLVTSSFWLLAWWCSENTNYGAFAIMLVGGSVLIGQILFALFLGSRITRKVIFEGRLKQRLKRLKKNLFVSERRHHQINDHLFEGVIIVDDQSRIIYANRSARKTLKLAKHLRDVSLAEAIREPEMHELMQQSKDQQRPFERTITVGGLESKKFLIRVSPMAEDELMISMLDITRASALDDKHNDFIAHASHELKTPISVILANAELLIDLSGDVPNYRHLLQAILRQALRAKNLLDSLLELLRFDAGHHSLSPELVELSKFVDDVKISLGHYGAMIKNDVHRNTVVWADRALLERMTLIIIENAQKYAGEDPRLSISSDRQKGKIKVQFVDNGPGIKRHLRERVFERFFRAPEHDRSDKEGFGLGLSQARAIANAMGGRIFVDDTVDKGCGISLYLAACEPEKGSDIDSHNAIP